MSDLISRLRITSAMISLGEKISWGQDTALMDEAAEMLEAMAARVAELEAANLELGLQCIADLGQAQEAYEAQKAAEDNAKALVAAALQRAASIMDGGWSYNAGNAIRALIDTDHAAALEAVRAQAREEAVDIAKMERIANELSCIDAQCRAFADRIIAAIRAGKVQP